MKNDPAKNVMMAAKGKIDSGDIYDIVVVGISETGHRILLYAASDIHEMSSALKWAIEEMEMSVPTSPTMH